MDKIREFMEANPDEGKELREKNRSFVFFPETPFGPTRSLLGAQGMPLTPWRSLAVDHRFTSTARRSGSTPPCRSIATSRRTTSSI